MVEGARDSTRRRRFREISAPTLVCCHDNETASQAPPPPRYARSPSPAIAGADDLQLERLVRRRVKQFIDCDFAFRQSLGVVLCQKIIEHFSVRLDAV